MTLFIIFLLLTTQGFAAEKSPVNSENKHYEFQRKFQCGKQPKDLTYSPDGRYLVISTMLEDYIQIVDTQNGSVRKLQVPAYGKYNGFVEGVFSKDGKEYWFNQMHTTGRIFVADSSDWTIKTNMRSHGDWTKVGEFSPDGQYYYVSNWLSATVTWFYAANYTYGGTIKTTGKEPRGIAFSEDGRYVYISMFGSGTIEKYDRDNAHKLVKIIEIGGTCGRIRMDYPRNKAYIGNLRQGCYFVLDLKSDTVIQKVPAGRNVNNIKLSPDGKRIYVSCRGLSGPKGYLYRNPENGKVMVFDAQTHEKIETLQVGNQPIGLALSPDGLYLAISNFMDDTVEIWKIKQS